MPTFQKYWSSIVLAILEILLTEEAVSCLLLVSISTSPISLDALISKGLFLPERCCQAARECVSLQMRLLPVPHKVCVWETLASLLAVFLAQESALGCSSYK